jgi:CDGSH-type Zn-finger protein
VTAQAHGSEMTETWCPDGPVLVRGADEVVDEAGVVHPVTRPVVVVCRCDKSHRLPWCDGTHKSVVRARRRRAAASDVRSAVESTTSEVERDVPQGA